MFKKLLTDFLSGPATPGGEAWSSHFFSSQKEKRKQSGKKERVSTQKISKECHHGQNFTVLAIPERLEFKKFSFRPTLVANNSFQCSTKATHL